MPCSVKLAAATADKMVHVFDDNGEKKDKFKTKAADANTSGNYLVRGLTFSPDSTKLAVAQSDNIIFVYRSAHHSRPSHSRYRLLQHIDH